MNHEQLRAQAENMICAYPHSSAGMIANSILSRIAEAVEKIDLRNPYNVSRLACIASEQARQSILELLRGVK